MEHGTIKLWLLGRVNLPRKSVWMGHWLAQPSWHLAATLPPKARRRDVVLGLGGAVSPFLILCVHIQAWKSAREGVARGSTVFASLGTRQDGQWQRGGWAGIASLVPVAKAAWRWCVRVVVDLESFYHPDGRELQK